MDKSDSIKDRNSCSSNDIKKMKKAAQLEEKNICYRQIIDISIDRQTDRKDK